MSTLARTTPRAWFDLPSGLREARCLPSARPVPSVGTLDNRNEQRIMDSAQPGVWIVPSERGTQVKRYTTAELDALPTLAIGQADSLKVDNGDGVRVWLSRVGKADDDTMPYEHTVYVERYDSATGRWETVETYDGDNPEGGAQ